MALTTTDLLVWLNANEAQPESLADATPSTPETELLQRTLDATRSVVVAHFQVPADEDDWTEDINTAVLMQAARYVNRRRTPEGVFAVSDFGAIRVATFDPDVKDLLAKYKLFRFSRSEAEIAATPNFP